jgi:anti-anti-sigma factor
MASIALSSSLVPGDVFVVLRGELNVTDATRFARALSVAAISVFRITVDLAGLASMDCSSMSALVSAYRQAGGDLALAVQLELPLRPDLPLELFGPVGPSVPFTMMAL